MPARGLSHISNLALESSFICVGFRLGIPNQTRRVIELAKGLNNTSPFSKSIVFGIWDKECEWVMGIRFQNTQGMQGPVGGKTIYEKVVSQGRIPTLAQQHFKIEQAQLSANAKTALFRWCATSSAV